MQRYIILFCLGINQFVFTQNSVALSIRAFSENPENKNAGISFMAVDLLTNEVIAGLNENLSLSTASTTKLFSTSTAIEVLGAEYQPETRLYLSGTLDNGVLNGSVWIRGGGDVTLGSSYFTKVGHERDFLVSWADTLRKLGIQSINGALVADGSAFGYTGAPDGWAWSDMGNYYGAGAGGICFYDNTVKFCFKTGNTPGEPTILHTTVPEIQGLIFRNYITSEKVVGDHSYIFGAPYSSDRFGRGALPLNQSNFIVKGSMPDPELQLAQELQKELNRIGITVSEGAKSMRQLNAYSPPNYNAFRQFYTQKGNTVQEIATLTTMKSVNLFAEGLVNLLGYKFSGKGTTEEGLKQIEHYWQHKIDTKGLFLTDGSGLSRSNGISASHFCALLKQLAMSSNYGIFRSTFPVAGKSGTIANLCKNQAGEGLILAKSGTLTGTKSYVGYVDAKSGKKIAFAFTVTNFSCSNNENIANMEKVLNALALY
jgi:D-alanyl-D-alanine carboxypeptidase/D-alanyl-D-alanine-endopeptidase (penicillin-binding protein 4)